MKTVKTTSLIMILMLTGLFLYSCTNSSESTDNGNIVESTPIPDAADSAGLANPASVYCEEQGGTLEIRTDADGNEHGVCVFEDGSECEEWAFFRGECQPGGAAANAASADLIGVIWVLQSYNQPVLTDTTLTIEFNADGQVNGSAGCNSYFGSYTLEGEGLISSPIGSTEMWCEGLMEQETAYLQMLQTATGLTVSADELIVHTPDGDMTFAPAANAALEGTDWVLSGIAQNDAVVSTWIDENITIKFIEGQVSGNSGCNSYGGSYEIDGSSLTLSELMSTMMACEEEVNQREAEFLAALATVSQFRTEMNQLILSDADGQNILFFTIPAS